MSRRRILFPTGILGGGGGYDWYVDGDIASSGNGKTLAGAFKTIAELSGNWAAGQSVWIEPLDGGGVYREEVLLPGNNAQVHSSGVVDPDTGDMTGGAIIDGSDIIAKGSITKTGGQTNVYQFTVTLPTRSGETNVPLLWGDDTYFTFQNSVANVDANAGTYYYAAVSGEITIYFHAVGSEDPTANSVVYTCAMRIAGVYGYAYSGTTVKGLTVRKSLGKDGPLKVGKTATVTDVLSEYGSIHNIYRRTGWNFTRVVAKYFYATTSNSFFIGNEDTPNSENGTDTDCWSISATAGTGIGWHSHYNTSGTFGAIQYTRCHAVNCLYSFQGNNAATITCTSCETGSSSYGYNLADATVEWHINSGSHVRATDGQGFVITQATFTGTFYVDSCTVSMPKSVAEGYIRVQSACTINCTNSTWTVTATTGGYRQIIVVITGKVATINASGNDYQIADAATDGLAITHYDAGFTIASDNNHFSHAQIRNYAGGTNYATVAAWQSAGYDTNSTVG